MYLFYFDPDNAPYMRTFLRNIYIFSNTELSFSGEPMWFIGGSKILNDIFREKTGENGENSKLDGIKRERVVFTSACIRSRWT